MHKELLVGGVKDSLAAEVARFEETFVEATAIFLFVKCSFDKKGLK